MPNTGILLMTDGSVCVGWVCAMRWSLMALRFELWLQLFISITGVKNHRHDNERTTVSWSWFGVNILNWEKKPDQKKKKNGVMGNVFKYVSTSITLTYVLPVSGHRFHCILLGGEVSVCFAARSPVGPVLDQNLCHPDRVKKLKTNILHYTQKIVYN